MIEYIRPHWSAPSHIEVVTTPRFIKTGTKLRDFNVSPFKGHQAFAQENRAMLKNDLGISKLHFMNQVHGTTVVEASDNPLEADGLYTMKPDTAIAVLTADCLPVVLTNKSGTFVSVVHAGWRGLAAGILDQALDQAFVTPDETLVWLGPRIGPQVFEVGPEVRDAFLNLDKALEGCFVPQESKYLCDLGAIALRLLKDRVAEVLDSQICTQKNHLFSHRTSAMSGRMATIARIRTCSTRQH